MTCPHCEIPWPHRIVKRSDHWTAHVADSQQLLGYLVISLHTHKEMLIDLTPEELSDLQELMRDLQHALGKAFSPDWYNYMQMGNFQRHLHLHLIPRYKQPRLFDGRQFVDERFGKLPERRWVFEEEGFLTALAEKIKEKL
jgi:diadenosine tetraphosphate (Ap4A) HIT family hydrolase